MTGTAHQLGTATRAEIASQPELWQQALDIAAAGVDHLPAVGERVLVVGCGTSYYVAVAFAMLREWHGCGPTDALVASELPPRLRRYDGVIAISRSGTSSELLDAVRTIRAQQPDTPVIALLGQQDTPLAALVSAVVDLSFADEVSVVQTRFPTTQLILLRAALAQAQQPAARHGPLTGLDRLPERARHALSGPLPRHDIRQLVVLGSGWGTAIAQEAALKVREAAGAWTEAYPVGEYRHGPVATCGPGTLVWGLDPVPADIVEAVTTAGGRVEHGCAEPLIELVRLQRFAVDLAVAGGRDPDRPRLLSRSVILSTTGRSTTS
jgi:fructoselysine-6-P-deglycase FrlB-like protein